MLAVLLLAIGLSMDAFAVALCKGMALKKVKLTDALLVGIWFGVFQGLMPTVGYFLGSAFSDFISAFDHWVAFALLTLIGLNMLRECLFGEEEESDPSLTARVMLPLAVATSIDALAAGIALAMEGGLPIWVSAPTITAITCILSAVGVWVGAKFGAYCKKGAEIAGGVILILLGVKIVLEHTGVLVF